MRWRWVWHAMVGHNHHMEFPVQGSLDWEFRCSCGHTTRDMDQALWMDGAWPGLVALLMAIGMVAWGTVLVLWWFQGGED